MPPTALVGSAGEAAAAKRRPTIRASQGFVKRLSSVPQPPPCPILPCLPVKAVWETFLFWEESWGPARTWEPIMASSALCLTSEQPPI